MVTAGMPAARVAIAGGGAAGFFAAIACAEASPETEVTIYEKGREFLSKVRISGGGRCNVTHACFDARELAERFPRGERELIGPFRRFQARDTIEWFERRGVALKTEPDGRIFPTTDSSKTIVDCLLRAAREAGVRLVPGVTAAAVRKRDGGFALGLSTGETVECDRLLLATGGCRSERAGRLAVSLGHALEPPVPSLFTFHVRAPWLTELAGISVESVEASVPNTSLRSTGPLLLTHAGLSGPAILRLSAWGARDLHRVDYRFPLRIHWLAPLRAETIAGRLASRRERHPARLVVNTREAPLAARLWERLVSSAGIDRTTRWTELSRGASHRLVEELTRTELAVEGKSLNKDEFVTCGGVSLRQVDFRTMESRVTRGLYFAGELLDVDGLTGGFNFQAAWTTGWIAGNAMAAGAVARAT